MVKETLNQSTSWEDGSRRRQVVDNTRGIIFLGTPHKGSEIASLGRIVFRMTEIFASQSANTKLLQALEGDSETLARITYNFSLTLKKHPSIGIHSFFEERQTRRGPFGIRIVPPESAQIGHPDEECAGIPANHRYMVKFESDADTGFRRVYPVVKRWVRDIMEEMNSEFYPSFLCTHYYHADDF